MFQEHTHTRAMDTKEAVILKEIRDSVAQLGERMSWVEHVQEDGSGSVWATTRRDHATYGAGVTHRGRVPRQ